MSVQIKPFRCDVVDKHPMELVYVILELVEKLKTDPKTVSFDTLYRHCYLLDLHHKSTAETLYGYLKTHIECCSDKMQTLINKVFLKTRARVNPEIYLKTHAEFTAELWVVVCNYHQTHPDAKGVNTLMISSEIMCDFLISSKTAEEYVSIYRLAYNLWLRDKTSAKSVYDKYRKLATTAGAQATKNISDAMFMVLRTC